MGDRSLALVDSLRNSILYRREELSASRTAVVRDQYFTHPLASNNIECRFILRRHLPNLEAHGDLALAQMGIKNVNKNSLEVGI